MPPKKRTAAGLPVPAPTRLESDSLSPQKKPQDMRAVRMMRNPIGHNERMAELRERSNEPFMRLLSHLIAAEPTLAALRAWAKKDPGKWAAAIVSVARVIGYGEKGAGVIGTAEDLAGKSDAELRQIAALLSSGKATVLLDVTPKTPTTPPKEEITPTGD